MFYFFSTFYVYCPQTHASVPMFSCREFEQINKRKSDLKLNSQIHKYRRKRKFTIEIVYFVVQTRLVPLTLTLYTNKKKNKRKKRKSKIMFSLLGFLSQRDTGFKPITIEKCFFVLSCLLDLLTIVFVFQGMSKNKKTNPPSQLIIKRKYLI